MRKQLLWALRIWALSGRIWALSDRIWALPDRIWALPDRIWALSGSILAPSDRSGRHRTVSGRYQSHLGAKGLYPDAIRPYLGATGLYLGATSHIWALKVCIQALSGRIWALPGRHVDSPPASRCVRTEMASEVSRTARPETLTVAGGWLPKLLSTRRCHWTVDSDTGVISSARSASRTVSRERRDVFWALPYVCGGSRGDRHSLRASGASTTRGAPGIFSRGGGCEIASMHSGQ